MSTFSSIVNSGASFIVCDFWQPYFKPEATDKETVRMSYFASLFVVIIGLAIGVNAKSIAQIWSWIMMALGAGIVVPNVLRWYWWRLNGWGYSMGTLGGMVCPCLPLFFPEQPMYVVFPLICISSLMLSVVVSFKTTRVDENVLNKFLHNYTPFRSLEKYSQNIWFDQINNYQVKSEKGWIAILNVIFGMCAISGMYLAPMFLVGHWYGKAVLWFIVIIISVTILKFTWYDNLPDRGIDKNIYPRITRIFTNLFDL